MILATLVFRFVDLGWVLARPLARAARDLEAATGRPVSVGPAHLVLLPEVAFSIEGLQIGAAPEEGAAAAPLAKIDALRARLAPWPLLSSLGRELRLRELSVAGLVLHLRRLPDGHLSHEGVVARLQQRERPPLSAALRDRLARLFIERATLRGALRCQQGQALSAIEAVVLSGADLRFDAPLSLSLSAAAFSPTVNVGGSAILGPLPTDLDLVPLALVRRAALHLAAMPLSGLACFSAGGEQPGILETMDLQLELPAEAGRLKLSGAARVRGLSRGELRIRADLDADPLAGDVHVGALDLSLGDLALSGTADLRRLLSAPQIHRLSLTSRGLRIEDLLALRPGRGQSSSRDGGFHGPASLSLSASGPPEQALITAELDLSEASLRLPFLRKEAQLPLSLALRARLAPRGLAIDRLALRLSKLRFAFTGKLHGGLLTLSPLPIEVDREALTETLPLLGPYLLRRAARAPALLPGGALSVDLEHGGALSGALTLSSATGGPPVALRLGGTLEAPVFTRAPADDEGGQQRAGPRPMLLRDRLRQKIGR